MDRNIVNALKIFARFSSPQEHEKLVNNFIKEMNFRVLIDQLKYFR